MNVQEGARRMRHAGVWLALIPASWIVLVFVLIQMGPMFHPGTGVAEGGFAFMGFLTIGEILLAAVPGVLLWIAAWIVEGFAKDSN
ncbi:MAG: hypothetical protein ABSE51_02885 [Terracidiphilus sp.]|jgi:hypothetical protein